MDQQDITRLQATLAALAAQRNQALDAVAQLQGDLASLKEELTLLRQEAQARDTPPIPPTSLDERPSPP